jgi:uncharacterized membrane protein
MTTMTEQKPNETNPDQLPFCAPCKKLDTLAPLNWLRLGWKDLTRAPRQSLTYGGMMLAISYFIAIISYTIGDIYLLAAMMSGFILMGPVLAIGLYSISCQIQNNMTPVLGYCLREGRKHISNEIIFAAILLVVFLVWARAAMMLHVFFPVEADPKVEDLLIFLGIGSAVGSVFAIIIFSAAAFSLPMIMDKKVDMVTAIITSINAVLRNKKTMIFWAGIIVSFVFLGFLTFFVGLAVLLPLIGHATWHAYQETIDASAWPDHD